MAQAVLVRDEQMRQQRLVSSAEKEEWAVIIVFRLYAFEEHDMSLAHMRILIHREVDPPRMCSGNLVMHQTI